MCQWNLGREQYKKMVNGYMMYIKTWGTRPFCAPVFYFMRLFSAWTGIISAASFYKKKDMLERLVIVISAGIC